MPIPLLAAVIIAAMVGMVAYALAHGSWAMRLFLALFFSFLVFAVEMIVFGVSGA